MDWYRNSQSSRNFFLEPCTHIKYETLTCEIDIELAWSTMEKGYPFIGSHEQLHEKISY